LKQPLRSVLYYPLRKPAKFILSLYRLDPNYAAWKLHGFDFPRQQPPIPAGCELAAFDLSDVNGFVFPAQIAPRC
jgi:hypothetical protein